MIDLILNILSGILLFFGSVFYIIGSIGLYRMPDVFARMHATSVSETAGSVLLLAGLMLLSGLSLVTLKLAVILILLLYTGPVATHALARAALHAGLRPKLHGESDKSDDKGELSSNP